MAALLLDERTLKNLREVVRKYTDQDASCESLAELRDRYEEESPAWESANRDLEMMRKKRISTAYLIADAMKEIVL